MSGELLSRPAGAAHLLVLNRPARRNALTPELARALAGEIDRVSESGPARAILLAGAGGHFCAGLDLHWLLSLGETPPVSALQHGLGDFQSAVVAVIRSPIPVVALVAGTAAGFGFDLALACDIRVAGRSASFTSAFARMGLVPDGGSTQTLPSLVGMGRALRLLLSSESLDADAAFMAGLVSDVVDDESLEASGRALADRIASGAASSVRAIKRLCRAAELGALEQVLASEGAAQIQALQSAEFRERLKAFAARTSGATERPA